MLKEYAIDPNVIASSFETCRYLVSQFGVDKGRLISRFPKTWKRLAIEAANHLPDGRKKEQVVQYLSGINNQWLTLISSNRNYPNPGGSWLDNALSVHVEHPFTAIICAQEDVSRQLVDANACDGGHALFAATRSCAVNRNAADLAQVATLLLKNCRTLRLVDPYFDPGRPKWHNPLTHILAGIPDINQVICEYHILERDNSPSTVELKQRLEQFQNVIPQGGSLRLIRWKEKANGERFHRRYLMTENAGLHYEGGLDEGTGANQTTDVSLLDQVHHQQRWQEYSFDSTAYELFHPILVVDSSGQVSEAQ